MLSVHSILRRRISKLQRNNGDGSGTNLHSAPRIVRPRVQNVSRTCLCSSLRMFPVNQAAPAFRHNNEMATGEHTSFEDNALLVKSLQQELKHFSTRLEYIRRKSCI